MSESEDTGNESVEAGIHPAMSRRGSKSVRTKFALPRRLARRQLVEAFAEPLEYDDIPPVKRMDDIWKAFQSEMSASDRPYVMVVGEQYVGKTTVIRHLARNMAAGPSAGCIPLLSGRTVMRVLPAVHASTMTPEAEAFRAYLKNFGHEDYDEVVFYTDDQRTASLMLSIKGGFPTPVIFENEDGHGIERINTPEISTNQSIDLIPDRSIAALTDHVCRIVAERGREYERKFGWIPPRTVIEAFVRAEARGATCMDFDLSEVILLIDRMCSEYASEHGGVRPTKAAAYSFLKGHLNLTADDIREVPGTMEFMDDDVAQTAGALGFVVAPNSKGDPFGPWRQWADISASEYASREHDGEADDADGTPTAEDMPGFTDAADLEAKLRRRVVGQDRAISEIIPPILRRRAGLSDDSKPIASLLFAGPSGVGKTETAKALAAAVFGDESAFKRIDCGELGQAGASRLIGTTQGFLGYDHEGELTGFVSRHPRSVILFDEIEKADPHLYDSVLLQLLDSARITGTVASKNKMGEPDVKSETVDASGCIIIMTSNLGSDKVADHGISRVGFGSETVDVRTRLRQDVMSAVTAQFRVEQINRFDGVVVFDPLDDSELAQVFLLKWGVFADRLKNKGFDVSMDESVPKWFASESRKDKFGARSIIRAMNERLINPLADGIVNGRLNDGTIHIGMDSDGTSLDIMKAPAPTDKGDGRIPKKRAKTKIVSDGRI